MRKAEGGRVRRGSELAYSTVVVNEHNLCTSILRFPFGIPVLGSIDQIMILDYDNGRKHTVRAWPTRYGRIILTLGI